MATCRGCGAEVKWIETTNKKPMPCDPPLVTVVTEAGETVRGHIPHWATCPKRQAFKPGGELRG